MNIVDTIFRARKSKATAKSGEPTAAIPGMLRNLGSQDTTKDDFNRAFLAGVETPHEEKGETSMTPTQAKPFGRDEAVDASVEAEAVASGEDMSAVTAEASEPEMTGAGDEFQEIDEEEAARLVETHAADIRIAEAEAGLTVLGLPDREEGGASDERSEPAIAYPGELDDEEPAAPAATGFPSAYRFDSEETAAQPSAALDDEIRESAASSYDPLPNLPRAKAGSPRLAEFAAFRAITSDMEDKLQAFSETVALSRLTFSSMQPFLEQFEADIQVSDEIERERNALTGELSDAKRALEVAQRELSAKLVALTAANDRNSELRIELEHRRQAAQEFSAKLDRARLEIDRLTSENATARAEIVKLVASLERETAEKENYYNTRVDLSNKLVKLQQSEAQTRNKLLEATLQNDKLTKMQPALVAEQEKLRNELRVAQREKAELQNRLLAAQDQAMQLESEIQGLQGHSASEAYAARTELEMHKSALRTSEKALAESEARHKELQKQLRESEAARQALENQIDTFQNELESARRERSEAAFKLSDVNLKYMTDLLSLDQQREQNKEFQYNIDALLADKRRMAKFETLYKAAESQIVSLKEKLALLAENLKDTTDPERLRQSIEIIGELSATQVPANTDTPPKGEGAVKKPATH